MDIALRDIRFGYAAAIRAGAAVDFIFDFLGYSPELELGKIVALQMPAELFVLDQLLLAELFDLDQIGNHVSQE